MKYINKYTKVIMGSFLLSMLLFSCQKFEEFDSESAKLGKPTVTISIVSVGDSTITVSAASDMEGFLSMSVLYGSDTTEYNRVDILTGNISDEVRLATSSNKVGANEQLTLSFESLVQNSSYKIVAVASNAEGNTSDVTELSFDTEDNYAPNALDVSPASGSSGQLNDFSVDLYFDEPVKLVDTSKIKFGYYDFATDALTWLTVSEDLITVDGNVVTFAQPKTPMYGQYCYLLVEEGAIADIIGNNWAGIASGIDNEGYDFGLYWRVEKDEALVEDFTPDVGETLTDAYFKVVMVFDRDLVDFYHFSEDIYDEASIVFTYEESDTILHRYSVPQDSITITGNTVTISQPRVPVNGEKIYLKIGAGAFRDSFYNPNEAWEITRDDSDGWLFSN